MIANIPPIKIPEIIDNYDSNDYKDIQKQYDEHKQYIERRYKKYLNKLRRDIDILNTEL